jgi:hypothetical protein
MVASRESMIRSEGITTGGLPLHCRRAFRKIHSLVGWAGVALSTKHDRRARATGAGDVNTAVNAAIKLKRFGCLGHPMRL